MGKAFIEIFTDVGFLGAFLQAIVLIFVGYLFRRKEWIPEDGKKTITAILWKIGIPCMAFNSFMVDFDKNGLVRSLSVMLIAVVVYAVSIFVSRLFLKRIGKDRARILSFFVAVGQVTLFAMPILSSVYEGNPEALLYANMLAIPFRIVVYVFGFFAIAGIKYDRENLRSSVKNIVLNPVMISMFAGLVIWLTQGILPKVSVSGGEYAFLRIDKTLPALYKVVKTLSSLVTPLAMFLIGFSLGGTPLKEAFTDKLAVGLAAAKAFLVPLFTLGIALLLQITGLAKFDEYALVSVVVGLGAPASATLGVFCVQYEKEELTSARICTLSALFCLVTVPLSFAIVRYLMTLPLFA